MKRDRLMMKGYWTWWRVVAWGGFVVLLLAYAQLAFRHDSSFFTVWWMPREMARRILKLTYYRNFWGFGFLGLYASLFLDAGWKAWRQGRIEWGAAVLWVLPVAKELAQVLVHGRHGTLFGASCGFVGMGCGLLLGAAVRRLCRHCKGWRVKGEGAEGVTRSYPAAR